MKEGKYSQQDLMGINIGIGLRRRAVVHEAVSSVFPVDDKGKKNSRLTPKAQRWVQVENWTSDLMKAIAV